MRKYPGGWNTSLCGTRGPKVERDAYMHKIWKSAIVCRITLVKHAAWVLFSVMSIRIWIDLYWDGPLNFEALQARAGTPHLYILSRSLCVCRYEPPGGASLDMPHLLQHQMSGWVNVAYHVSAMHLQPKSHPVLDCIQSHENTLRSPRTAVASRKFAPKGSALPIIKEHSCTRGSGPASNRPRVGSNTPQAPPRATAPMKRPSLPHVATGTFPQARTSGRS